MQNPQNILITGAAGFIGANFTHYWLRNHPQDTVLALDALHYAGNLANLEKIKNKQNFRFVKGDIGDTHFVRKLIADHGIQTLVNFAAESHVDRSISGPDAFIQSNVIGTYGLLQAAKAEWLDSATKPLSHHFHHVSTDEVYGSLGPSDPAFTEQTAFAPNSPYSASKASSDHLVRAWCHTYGLKVTTSNCSNNYGPYQFPEKLIPLVIIHILNNQPLPVYGDGQQIRDWLYVEDHVRGIELVLRKGKSGETYNIGGDNEWANIDIIKLLGRLVESEFQSKPELQVQFPNALAAINGDTASLIEHVSDRPGHDRRYAIDASKARSDLGYEPLETFESGILKTLRWYLNHPAWWSAVLDGRYRNLDPARD